MNLKTIIKDEERLEELQREVWNIATAHGWHDKPISREQYLGLVITEASEAVEADRNDKRARTDEMEYVMVTQANSEYGLTPEWYSMWFEDYYEEYVKGTVEEEFADVIIRLIDMAAGIHGNKMTWDKIYPFDSLYDPEKNFIENFWIFVRYVLNYNMSYIRDSVSYIFDWANHIGISTDWMWLHIEWKVKYNELRPYKHGGKKY